MKWIDKGVAEGKNNIILGLDWLWPK
jgi:hypothetical protein